jgi:two-component system OmpR family response regulator
MVRSDPSHRALLVATPSYLVRLAGRDLRKAGLAVAVALHGTDALAAISTSEPDAVIIGPTDEINSVFDNYRAIRRVLRIRHAVTVPILILIEPDERDAAISTLETGHDDFLVLPFSPGVLASRIRLSLEADRTDARPARIRYASITIDVRRHSIYCGGREVALSPTEFAVLVLLTTDPGRVYSRKEILHSLQREDRQVSERAGDAQIRGLRHALGDCGELVQTVRSVGYRMR